MTRVQHTDYSLSSILLPAQSQQYRAIFLGRRVYFGICSKQTCLCQGGRRAVLMSCDADQAVQCNFGAHFNSKLCLCLRLIRPPLIANVNMKQSDICLKIQLKDSKSVTGRLTSFTNNILHVTERNPEMTILSFRMSDIFLFID